MGRLIDADALLQDIRENMPNYEVKEDFLLFVHAQPTAYDVENVVEEIKSQFGCKDCEYADVYPTPYVCLGECAELEVINDICDIVKKGGVE